LLEGIRLKLPLPSVTISIAATGSILFRGEGGIIIALPPVTITGHRLAVAVMPAFAALGRTESRSA